MDKEMVKQAAKRWAANNNCSVIGKVWMPDDEDDVEDFADWFVKVMDGVLSNMKRGNPRELPQRWPIQRDNQNWKIQGIVEHWNTSVKVHEEHPPGLMLFHGALGQPQAFLDHLIEQHGFYWLEGEDPSTIRLAEIHERDHHFDGKDHLKIREDREKRMRE